MLVVTVRVFPWFVLFVPLFLGEKLCLILVRFSSFSVVCFENSDVNRLSLSVMMSCGMQCNCMISFPKSVANCRVSWFYLHGMQWLIFVRRLMTTSILSYPSELGKSMIKSTTIDFHGWSGTWFD